jgi:putative ATP-dependent endonuclease of OLD family
MYISYICIKNFRNFEFFEIKLNPFSIIIGENDAGKSNLLEAMQLVLSNNSIDYFSKALKISDLNKNALGTFILQIVDKSNDLLQALKEKKDVKEFIDLVPVVEITVRFTDPKEAYEMALLDDWKNEENGDMFYEIKYICEPIKYNDVLEYCAYMANELKDKAGIGYPIELYDYKIISTNNDKKVDYKSMKNFMISSIKAERDTFSENENNKSNKLISTMLEKNLSDNDRIAIFKSYQEFFEKIGSADSFKKVFDNDAAKEIENLDDHLSKIVLTPNFPNTKNIFSNIALSYGNEFLYQKGLGKRNFIYMLFVFSYFNSYTEGFNTIFLEEPEAHLCVNNFNLILDFITKFLKSKNNSRLQVILTTHNQKAINKLKLNNVIVLSKDKAISFKNVDKQLVNYLAKRPNFDILKLLFANRVILVEGPTEEMFINTYLETITHKISTIEVIAIGHRGFRTFLDIWLELNKSNTSRKIGIVRDYDNLENSKLEHDKYDETYENIIVRTTVGYTFENDFVNCNKNREVLGAFLDVTAEKLEDKLISDKAEYMMKICDGIINEEIIIDPPKHILEVVEWMIE